MKKIASLLAAAALLAACGNPMDPMEIREVLPRAAEIQIGNPDATPAANALTAAAEEPAYGSEYAQKSYWMAVTVNLGVWWTLKLVETITFFPATCTDDACTWGPWHDQNNHWKLVVSRSGDAGYAYELLGRKGSTPQGPFVPVVSGVAFPGRDRRHGHGSFTVDFEAEADLDHGALWVQENFGTLDVEYDNRDALSIDATFLAARGKEDGTLLNAAYAFDATGAGGELQVAFRTLEGDPQNVVLRTRWDETGAGRGDARYHATDGSWTVEYEASECWSGAPTFALVYDTDPALGAETSCAYAAALYSDLTVP